MRAIKLSTTSRRCAPTYIAKMCALIEGTHVLCLHNVCGSRISIRRCWRCASRRRCFHAAGRQRQQVHPQHTETCILLPIARFLTQLQSFREDGGSLWSGRTRWPRASPSFVSFFYVRLIDCSLMLFQVGDVIISVDGESVVGMVSPLPYCPSLVIQMF